MRNTIFAVSFVSLLSSAGALSAADSIKPAPVEDAKRAVTLGTPSGVGDPNNVVCRAPQPIPGSEQLGPQVCLHNSEWWKLAMNGKDVAPDGQSLIDRPTVDDPRGKGDPEAITCRTPKFVSRGPLVPVCRTNQFWADVIKSHQMVDAGGKVLPRRVPIDYGNPDAVGFTSQGGDSGQWQSGMPIPTLGNR